MLTVLRRVTVLYLASQSPRRRELLQQLDVDFRQLAVEVPEEPAAGEAPVDYIDRVARAKAHAGLEAVSAAAGTAVLAGDTEVVMDGVVFGKPESIADARGMLERLSGRVHTAVSSVWLVTAEAEASAQCQSHVTFATLDATELSAYLASGESQGKAGGYAIQGRAAAFVRRLEGSYSGVMGLPLHETARLLRRFELWPEPTAAAGTA